MSDLVTVTIDDTEMLVPAGITILQAARMAGIRIPSLCYLEGLSVWGACRICVVEVAEQPGLRPACATKVAEDMVVRTRTERLRSYRRSILELLFAEGNHVCAVCVANGSCELQDAAVEAGMDHVRFDYRNPARGVDASHPKYVFDPNRCILCTRCVRTCDEVEGAHVWDVAARGHKAHLITELDEPWGDSAACTWCGKCVAVCPTGALSYQHTAVGEMRHDPDMVGRLVTARTRRKWRRPGKEAT